MDKLEKGLGIQFRPTTPGHLELVADPERERDLSTLAGFLSRHDGALRQVVEDVRKESRGFDYATALRRANEWNAVMIEPAGHSAREIASARLLLGWTRSVAFDSLTLDHLVRNGLRGLLRADSVVSGNFAHLDSIHAPTRDGTTYREQLERLARTTDWARIYGSQSVDEVMTRGMVVRRVSFDPASLSVRHSIQGIARPGALGTRGSGELIPELIERPVPSIDGFLRSMGAAGGDYALRRLRTSAFLREETERLAPSPSRSLALAALRWCRQRSMDLVMDYSAARDERASLPGLTGSPNTLLELFAPSPPSPASVERFLALESEREDLLNPVPLGPRQRASALVDRAANALWSLERSGTTLYVRNECRFLDVEPSYPVEALLELELTGVSSGGQSSYPFQAVQEFCGRCDDADASRLRRTSPSLGPIGLGEYVPFGMLVQRLAPGVRSAMLRGLSEKGTFTLLCADIPAAVRSDFTKCLKARSLAGETLRDQAAGCNAIDAAIMHPLFSTVLSVGKIDFAFKARPDDPSCGELLASLAVRSVGPAGSPGPSSGTTPFLRLFGASMGSISLAVTNR